MVRERAQDYLGAVYRLRGRLGGPVPLSRLSKYFKYSPVSVHEMVQKLDEQNLLVYHPYRGVKLTEAGETVARALLRRHRLWERFLTDLLDVPWGEAHEIAEKLEHAAPDSVTERLAGLLDNPKHCPHGGIIPPLDQTSLDWRLSELEVGVQGYIARISPESPDVLRTLEGLGMMLESQLEVLSQPEGGTVVSVSGEALCLLKTLSQTLWVYVCNDDMEG